MAADKTYQDMTNLGDLPEACLAQAIALTSPRDACRLAAVSSSFRAAADSDLVWQRFIPEQLDHPAVLLQAPPSPAAASTTNRFVTARKKDAYLGLCDRSGVPIDGGDDGECRVWLERASGAKCYALSARRLSLPWDDGEHSWKWMTTHQGSRFGEVAELVDCMCLDIYARLPAVARTPATSYAAYLIYGTAEGHRGLSYPDQETTVAVGGNVLERHRVCLRPDDIEMSKFRGAGMIAVEEQEKPRGPIKRGDRWWEMEMGRLHLTNTSGEEKDVVASFEIFGWYPKSGLILESVEFRPVHS